MPTIIALETGRDQSLCNIATKLHRQLNEKHESLIESCYLDGVKLAYRYQMRLNGNHIVLEPDMACLQTLYSIVRTSRKGRQKFLVALTKSLDTNLNKLDGLMETDVKYAQFIAHNIACLAYTASEEIHLVIHTIDKLLSTTGASLVQLLESEDSSSGRAAEQLGKAAAIAAYAMSLRHQLKLVYGITETKCLAFNPYKLGNRSEVKSVARQPGIPLVPDWSSVNAPATAQQRRAHLLDVFSRDEHRFQAKREASHESLEEQRHSEQES